MVSYARNIIICFILAYSTYAQNVPWARPNITSSTSKLIINCIPTVNSVALDPNDYIGVFDSIDNCFGLAQWKDTTDYSIAVYGSNDATSTTGFRNGAKMKFKVWLYKEDCIVENIAQVSSDAELVYETTTTNRVTTLNFEKTSVHYPKSEYCLNTDAVSPVINYRPQQLSFLPLSNTGLYIDSKTGIVDPRKCTPGTYTISIDAQKNCVTNKNVTLTLRDYPRLQQIPDTFICGEHLSIKGPEGFSSLEWSTGQTASDIEITEPATISYKVTNAYGCANADTFSVKKTALNRIDYSTITADCEKKGRLNITGTDISNGRQPYTYKLTNLIDNSIVSDIENVPEGLYRITVINSNGCELSYNAKVILEKDCLNDKPVFTPNADGMDDRYFINLEGKIKIYDRNGKLKRTLQGPVYFDGNDENAHPLPMGTYLVVADNGKTVTLTIVK
jgi:hypothetical protein